MIPPGSSIKTIGRMLEEKELIRSHYVFQGVVIAQKLTTKIQAGAFALSPSQDAFSLAQSLTKGTSDIKVTLKEGLRAEEIGAILEENLPNFDRSSAEYQTECLDYEGYLFPETYFIPTSYDTRQTCRLLRQQYGEKMTMAMREKIHADGKTEEEIVSMASIIAREARTSADMKRVSGVLWNRLDIGMPLQVDATLQYIKGYDRNKETWWPVPLAADKELESPYNTYKYAKLPPGPISNPGLNALEAAISPTPSEDLYYISDKKGVNMYFAPTYEEHKRYIDLYLR